MGALRYNDKKRVCFMIKKGNSETFHEQLKKLNEEIRQEWINDKLGKSARRFSRKETEDYHYIRQC